ncbi:hypothetical protein FGB62_13g20 [Gracilaria domingensis]|nr:hypothetical protein FGB62_13g20 [Gracilaria domingensis]
MLSGQHSLNQSLIAAPWMAVRRLGRGSAALASIRVRVQQREKGIRTTRARNRMYVLTRLAADRRRRERTRKGADGAGGARRRALAQTDAPWFAAPNGAKLSAAAKGRTARQHVHALKRSNVARPAALVSAL